MRAFTPLSDSVEMKLFTLAGSENVWKYPGHQVAQATGVTWWCKAGGGGGQMPHQLFLYPISLLSQWDEEGQIKNYILKTIIVVL